MNFKLVNAGKLTQTDCDDMEIKKKLWWFRRILRQEQDEREKTLPAKKQIRQWRKTY